MFWMEDWEQEAVFFNLIAADRLIHRAFLKYTTGGTELTLFSVKFIQALRLCE